MLGSQMSNLNERMTGFSSREMLNSHGDNVCVSLDLHDDRLCVGELRLVVH